MENKKKYNVVICILTICVVLLLCVIGLNTFGVINLCKGNTNANSVNNCPKCSDSKECDCPKCEEKECNCSKNGETVNNKALTIVDGENSNGNKYSVEWINGDITVKLGNESKVIASDIDEYYDYHYGTSSICEGNRVLIFVANKKIVSSLSVDELSCDNTIKVKNDFSKVGIFSKLVQKSKFNNEYEPLNYSIYAINSANGSELDITSYFAN